MDQQYFYQPLPPVISSSKSPPFTRLVRLRAGELHSPLRCSMIVVNVEQCVQYESLSYVWGSEEPQSSIEIDGGHLRIKPNLTSALMHLRLSTQDRYLWVDAICINQADSYEKTRQVLHMRQVYKNAARVIVWLGLKSHGIESAFQLVSRLAELESLMLSDSLSNTHGWNIGVRKELIHDVIRDSPPESIQRLGELFERAYFSRIWCVQEVASCSWAIARCEELEIPFFDIISTLNLIHLYPEVTFKGTNLQFWHQICRAHLARRMKPKSAPIDPGTEGSVGSLLNILASTRDFGATDPRDKIFGIFGISKEALDPVSYLTQAGRESGTRTTKEKLLRKFIYAISDFAKEHEIDSDILRPEILKPNYGKSCVEVYRDFTRHQMTRGPRLLNVLHHICHTQPVGMDEFPSWVPKWFEPMNCQFAQAVLYCAGICQGQSPYIANVHDNPLDGEANHPNVLSIDGFYVDEVIATGVCMEAKEFNNIPLEQLWQPLFGYPLFPRVPQTYRNGEPLDAAFCLALQMGALATCTFIGIDIRNSRHNVYETGKTASPDAVELESLARADVQQFLRDYCTSRGFGNQGPQQKIATARVNEQGSSDRYEAGVRLYAYGRRVFLTRNGYLGLGPEMTQPGDQICVLYGGRLPFVIRTTGDNYHHFLLGPCYVHDQDIMWGKAGERVRSNHPDRQFNGQTFHLR